MISVVIPTHESERALVHTLAALVPGALDGLIREVIVADGGSRDATADVADVAGCRFLPLPGAPGARLAEAAAAARGPWLWFLEPGSIPQDRWIDTVARFVSAAGDARAAVFQLSEPVSLRHLVRRLIVSIGGMASASQGLLIAKTLYQSLGAHRDDAPDPAVDLLRRLGRRRIAVLDCTMARCI